MNDFILALGKYTGITLIFGVSSWLFKVHKKQTKFNKFDAMFEIVMSIVSAFLAYLLCYTFEVQDKYTYLIIAMSSWMGTTFIEIVQMFLVKLVSKKFDIDLSEAEKVLTKKEEVIEEKEKSIGE